MVLFSILAFPIRVVISIICIFVFIMERLAEWVAGIKNKTEYIKKGKCKRCGKCCELLGIYIPKPLRKLSRSIAAWHKLAYNFEFHGIDEGWHLYRCNYIKEGGRCGIYWFRFRLCRDFPKPKYFGRPYIYRNCGYYFERRDGRPDFERILREKISSKEIMFK